MDAPISMIYRSRLRQSTDSKPRDSGTEINELGEVVELHRDDSS